MMVGISILVDPEGGVIAGAGEREAIKTARLDLERVARVRAAGTVGECQSLKSFRDGGVSFPVYAQGVAAGEGFKGLEPILQNRR